MPAIVWLILTGAFFVDATVTLVRRLARGHRWSSAHRLHAYQRAVEFGASHLRVTMAVLLVNLGLGGLAWLVTAHPPWLMTGLAAAWAWLGVLYWLVERRVPMWDSGSNGSGLLRRSHTGRGGQPGRSA
jgi:Fuc2NAc and GlcNAc transferase